MGTGLSFVPEAVAFRGISGDSSTKRTLLVQNSDGDSVEALVTEPLSGLFKLHFPSEQPKQAEFFHKITVPGLATLKFSVEFSPDKQALKHYENFQDMVIFHTLHHTAQVPIKACKDQVPMTSLRRTQAAKAEQAFWPPCEELSSWVEGLMEEVRKYSSEPDKSEGAPGGPPCDGMADTSDRLADEMAGLDLSGPDEPMPPQGLSLRRPMPTQEPDTSESAAATGVVTLQPPVVLMGRTAFSTTKQSKLLQPPPEPITRNAETEVMPGSNAAPTPARRDTLYIIDGGLIDSKGRSVNLSGMSPEEVRQRYVLVQCSTEVTQASSPQSLTRLYSAPAESNGRHKGALSGVRPPTEGSAAPVSMESTFDMHANGGVNPVALAAAAAELGLTLEDLPPPLADTTGRSTTSTRAMAGTQAAPQMYPLGPSTSVFPLGSTLGPSALDTVEETSHVGAGSPPASAGATGVSRPREGGTRSPANHRSHHLPKPPPAGASRPPVTTVRNGSRLGSLVRREDIETMEANWDALS